MHDPPANSIEAMYGPASPDDEAIAAALDRTPAPRGPSLWLDRALGLGVTPGDVVLDAGCGDAGHACSFAERAGCRVIGVEPVRAAAARATVAERGLAGRVEIREGRLEALPLADGEVRFALCRDVTNHIAETAIALAECSRVLAPGGSVLVFQTFATGRLEPREAAELFRMLATHERSMDPAHFESAARAAGLQIRECDRVGSEWREHGEREGGGRTSAQLLRVARLRRDRERLVREWGEAAWATELGDCLWGVYQMLGKLEPRIYRLDRPAG